MGLAFLQATEGGVPLALMLGGALVLVGLGMVGALVWRANAARKRSSGSDVTAVAMPNAQVTVQSRSPLPGTQANLITADQPTPILPNVRQRPGETQQMERLPPEVRATLQIESVPRPENYTSRTMDVDMQTYWIGRDKNMSLMIPEKPISSTHACLNWAEGRYFLIDYSRNGTWINGERLSARTPYPLSVDTNYRIQLARDCAVLTFRYTLDSFAGRANASDITDQQLAFTPQDAPTAEINIAAPVEPVTSDVPVSASGKRRSSERAALIPEILPTLTLIEENGRDVHREVPMYTEQFTIGRNRERDCVIESRHVSRLHATLRWNGDAFEIEDNDSQNGVYVDNEPIPPRSPVVLRPGLLYVIHLSRHADEPTSLTFIYEDNRPISFEGA